MVRNKRQHKRFSVDLMEINGRMPLAGKVEIIDVSPGGIALRTDKRLMVGKEYQIKLETRRKQINIKGVVVRCELSGIEDRGNGEGVSMYTAGIKFRDVQKDVITGGSENAS